ncbi:hypothetical protein Z043_121323 [Scleropages formosus]|uniref:Family with sequence similarity 210 member Ab n=1 Tax=Scleropages formosus TaxID=113540 RepID=A0A0P7U1R0_SCLFO|nr:uncharacterized protein C18orf19 homolog B-like [Scleropages formosus]KPP60654.1 hypothetical protein Z043_121323 [Scleropages formosus]
MLRFLSQKALLRMAAVRSALGGLASLDTVPGARVATGRKPGVCWVSSSVALRATGPTGPPPKDEAPLSPPRSLAGADPQRGAAPQEPGPGSALEDPADHDPLQDKSMGLFQRFKKTFKQYGKVMIPVHLVTSTVWFGTFYYSAMKGVNVVPFLEFIGLPEKIVNILKNSQGGNALTAYAMYKIATPARYTVTLGGTSWTVKYLRKHGYLSTPPPVKDYIHDKMEETRERISEKMEETRERISEKMEETKERFVEKVEETKERFSGRMEETRERLADKVEETKDKISGKLQETKDKVSFRKKAE